MTEDINTNLTPDEHITFEDFEDPATYEHKLELVANGLKRPDMEREFVHHLILHNPFFDIINDFKSEYLYYSEYMELFDFAKKKIEQDEEVNLLTIREYYFKDFDPITAQEHYDAFTDRVNHASKKTIKHYAKTLKKLYYKRGAIDNFLGAVRDIKYKPELTLTELANATNQMTENLEEASQTDDDLTSEMDFSSGFEELEQQIRDGTFKDRHSTGMSSGFKCLDKITGGLHPGELTVIGAKTGFGKTTFTTNMACNLLKTLNKSTDGKSKEVVIFYSMEMTALSLRKRILVTFSDLTLDKLNNNATEEDKETASKAFDELKQLGLIIKDRAGITTQDIQKDLITAKKHNYIVKAVFIDYLQKMTIENSNPNKKTEEITKISDELKQLALSKEIPVVAIAQFNRSFSNREDPTPENTDFKNSSSIEQDSDIIILMYQKHKTKAKTDNPDPLIMKDNKVIIRVSKNRHGKEGDVNMVFNKDKLKFTEDKYDL